jgi:hypothetical protein
MTSAAVTAADTFDNYVVHRAPFTGVVGEAMRALSLEVQRCATSEAIINANLSRVLDGSNVLDVGPPPESPMIQGQGTHYEGQVSRYTVVWPVPDGTARGAWLSIGRRNFSLQVNGIQEQKVPDAQLVNAME